MVRGCKQRVSSLKQQTRAAPNTSAGSAKAPLPEPRLRQGFSTLSFTFPRRALEIQPYRGVGQCMDSKLRARPVNSPGVLVLARLDARAAVAQILRFVMSCKGHGPG